MALIHLLKDRECLFLLDEPETHFNDMWKRDLVNQIELTLADTNSAVILTTHESVTLTDAYPEEVVILTTNGQRNVPLTLGAEPGELLRSLFGAEQSAGLRAKRQIDQTIAEAVRNNDSQSLLKLLDQVGTGYYRFKVIEALRDVSPDQLPRL
jgi:ABC-type nitrate/sulfonate/bicarbonate transport system ATPase subunit